MRFTECFLRQAPKLGVCSLLLILLASCSSLQRTRIEFPLPASPAAGEPEIRPARPSRDWAEYRVHAALRVVEANREHVYEGQPPDPLASIPSLTIHLNEDGSVQRVEVMRTPRFYPQSVEWAEKAIRRAGPLGPISHLPKPWQFNETFLYRYGDFKFQLLSLQ